MSNHWLKIHLATIAVAFVLYGCIDWLGEVEIARAEFSKIFSAEDGYGKKLNQHCKPRIEYEIQRPQKTIAFRASLGNQASDWDVTFEALWRIKEKKLEIGGTTLTRTKRGQEISRQTVAKGDAAAALRNAWDFGRLTGLCAMVEVDEDLALKKLIFNSPVGEAIWGKSPKNWLRLLTPGLHAEWQTEVKALSGEVFNFIQNVDVLSVGPAEVRYSVFAADAKNPKIKLEIEGEKEAIELENYLVKQDVICDLNEIACRDLEDESSPLAVPPFLLDQREWEFVQAGREPIATEVGEFDAVRLVFRSLKSKDQTATVWLSTSTPFYLLKRLTPTENVVLSRLGAKPEEQPPKH